MWAYQLVAPRRFARVEVPEPSTDLPAGRVLLRTRAGGMCGSDLPNFRGTPTLHGNGYPGPPGYPMHEVVGEVVASAHPGIAVGRSVVGWASDSTALAEYVVTDGDQVHPYAATTEEPVAVLIQSLACVLYALRDTEVAGRHVAVLGLGPIGLLFAHEAARRGAARVTGVDPVDRRDMTDRFGVDDLVTGTAGEWAAAGTADVVIEAVGHQTATLNDALVGCVTGGQVIYFGIPDTRVYPIDMELMVRKNLTLRAGITRDRPAALALADARLAADLPAYRGLITDVLRFDEVPRAFEAACAPRAGQAKVVLHG